LQVGTGKIKTALAKVILVR